MVNWNLKVLLVTAIVISRLCVGQVQALDITFTSDGVIQASDIYENVYILSNATVDMTGGYILNEVRPQDQSTFNFSGDFIRLLYPSDSSTVNITGGTINYVYTHDQSTINFSGGSIWDLSAFGSSTVNITGGALQGYLDLYHSNQVNITIYNIEMDAIDFYLGGGTATIYGGNISADNFILGSEANLNVFGGNVRFEVFDFPSGGPNEEDAFIIYGYDFNYSPDSYVFTGSLLLGGQIKIEDLSPEGYEYFRSNLVVVPAEVSKVIQAVFEKAGMAKQLSQTLDKDRQAYNAFGQLLESGDYGDLNKADIVKARQKLHAVIGHQEQSLDMLQKSIEKLKDALAALGWEELVEQLVQQ